MAILPKLPGVEVAICVDKRPLREYPDNDFQAEAGDMRESKTVSTYVQSDIKEFAIKLKVLPQFNFDCPTLGFQVYVDGSLVRAPIVRKVNYDSKKRLLLLVDCVKYAVTEGQQQKCVQHKFRFSKIDTSELLHPPRPRSFTD